MSSNLVYELLGDLSLVISCQTRDFPTDAEWDSWLAVAANLERTAKGSRLLVVTEGGHPTKAQLERIRAINRSNPATAIVSPSFGFRFMATAFTFVNPTIRCFAPAEYHKAFEHLGIAVHDRERVQRVIERLSQQLIEGSSAA